MKRLTVAPRTPEWHDIRNDCWTASAGAVLVVRENAELLQAHAKAKGIHLDIEPLVAVGIESFFGNTPWKTWADKVGRIPRFRGNAHTERGTNYEELVVANFEESQMIAVERDVTVIATGDEWLLASYDALAPSSSDTSVVAPFGFPVEAKCPAFQSRKKLWDSQREGKLAVMGLPYYWVQVQHQILVAEAPYGWFAAAGVEPDADGVERIIFPLREKVPRDDVFLKAYKAIAQYYHEEFIATYVEPPKLPSDEKLLEDLAKQAEFDKALSAENPAAAVDLYIEALKAENSATVLRKELEAKLLAAAVKLRVEGSEFVLLADKLQVSYGTAQTVSWQKLAKDLGKTVTGGLTPAFMETYTSARATVKIKEVA